MKQDLNLLGKKSKKAFLDKIKSNKTIDLMKFLENRYTGPLIRSTASVKVFPWTWCSLIFTM